MTQRVCYEQGLQLHTGKKKLVEAGSRADGGSPLPSWKLYENPFYDGLAAAVVAAASAAAAVAMAGKPHHEEHKEEDSGLQRQKSKNMARASSASPPANRAGPSAALQRGEKVSSMRNQGPKAGGSTMANAGRSSVPLRRRAPLPITGRVSMNFCNEEAQVAESMADYDDGDDDAMDHRTTSLHGAFGNGVSMEGALNNKDLKVGRGRATSSGHGALAGRSRTELSSKESAMVMMQDRAFDEENAAVLDMRPICLPASCERMESSCSPRSHLQPRPPSSTSGSPCSSKPVKVPNLSTRSPQPNRSLQPISPPLRTITLMRPKAAGDVLRSRNSAFKSASSSHRSPLPGDAAEHLHPRTDINLNLADTGIITSPRDYLKAINRSRVGIEEKQMESSPVVSALSEELKRALTRVQELERFQTSARKEVDGLLKRFADERALLRNREQENIQAAVFSIDEELDKERKLRKKLELENRKLSRSLAESKKTVVKTEKALDTEMKARQLMEDVCDELAREIGEDKAELEELKREHARAREEMEEERRTLQMTEAWREERVQMKLSEAKYELEERCVALDKLKLELEMYLSSRQAQEGEEAFYDEEGEDLRAATEKLKADASWSMLLLENGSSHAPQIQDDALSSDDIHSLRLSRDNIRSQSEWAAHSDVRTSDRAKWDFDYARDESSRFIASDNATEDESSKVMSTFKAYSDAQNRSSWFSPKLVSKWGMAKESVAGMVGRHNGLATFDDSDSEGERGSDEENRIEAESILGYTRHNKHGNNQGERSRWNAEGDDSMNVLGDDVNEIASASEEERGSRASSSPGLGRRRLKQGLRVRRMYQNQGFYGTGGKYNQHGSLVGARLNEDDESENAISEFSPAVHKHTANNADFMAAAQKEDWLGVPVYRSASQGRRGPLVTENSALQGKRDLVQWPKPSRRNHSHQTTILLEDRMNELQLQARHSKGSRPSR